MTLLLKEWIEGEYKMDTENVFNPEHLSYVTENQKQYIRKAQIPFDGYQNRLQLELENLQKPEASWTTKDLIASGAKFSVTIMGRTDNINPDNTYLVGYKAFLNMISCYSFMAAYTQTVLNDTLHCKDYLYLAAYCQKCLCNWPDNELRVTTGLVSLGQIEKFLIAIVADAEDGFIADLGQLLMLPERNRKDKLLIARGEATICLATGDYKKAYLRAEQLQNILDKTKRPNSMWRYYAQSIQAIINQDETVFNTALCNFINKCRKTDSPEIPTLLIFHASALAKLAVKNGLSVAIDTLDCPQVLIQPTQMDYSHLELPRPKYGFPWEK